MLWRQARTAVVAAQLPQASCCQRVVVARIPASTLSGIVVPSKSATPCPLSAPAIQAKASRLLSPRLTENLWLLGPLQSNETDPPGSGPISGMQTSLGNARMYASAVSIALGWRARAPYPSQSGARHSRVASRKLRMAAARSSRCTSHSIDGKASVSLVEILIYQPSRRDPTARPARLS